MIVPVGADHRPFRRLPWIIFLFAAVSLALYVPARSARDRSELRARAALARVADFAREHPFVDIPAAAAEALARWGMIDHATFPTEGRSDPFHAAVARPERAAGLQAARARMDALTGQALARVSESPWPRWSWSAAAPAPLAMLSHPFVHFDLGGLGAVIALCLLAGFAYEARMGALAALAVLATGALSGAVVYLLASAEGARPLVGGASAGAALLGAAIAQFRTAPLSLQVGLRGRWGGGGGVFDIPILLLLPLWVLERLAQALLGDGEFGGGRAAVGASVIALGAGAALAWVLDRFDLGAGEPLSASPPTGGGVGGSLSRLWGSLTSRRQAPDAIDSVDLWTPHAEEEVEVAVEPIDTPAEEPEEVAASPAEAEGTTPRPERREPRSRTMLYQDALEVWRATRSREAPAAGLQPIIDLVALNLRRQRAVKAVALWEEIDEWLPDAEVPLDLLVQLANAYVELGRPQDAALCVQRVALHGVADLEPPLMLAVVRLARALDPELARELGAEALASEGLNDRQRAELSRLLPDEG